MVPVHPGVNHRHQHISTRRPPRPQVLRSQRLQVPLIRRLRIPPMAVINRHPQRAANRQHLRSRSEPLSHILHRPSPQRFVFQHQTTINQPQHLHHIIPRRNSNHRWTPRRILKQLHHLLQPTQVDTRHRRSHQRIKPPIPIRGNRVECCLPILLD